VVQTEDGNAVWQKRPADRPVYLVTLGSLIGIGGYSGYLLIKWIFPNLI